MIAVGKIVFRCQVPVMQYLKISLPYSSDMRNCSNVVPPNSFMLLTFKFLSTIIY